MNLAMKATTAVRSSAGLCGLGGGGGGGRGLFSVTGWVPMLFAAGAGISSTLT